MKKYILSFIVLAAQIALYAQSNMAKAEQIGGLYIFNDCTPLSEYEVIGEVSFGGGNHSSIGMTPNGMGGFTTTVTSHTPQYTSIRNGLIVNAILANREVEGLILRVEKEGMGSAAMIKFKEKNPENALAKVKNYRGLYVFSDCKPVSDYSIIKNVKGNVMYLDCSYPYLRDKLVKKASKKKNISGVIIYLVEDGIDYVEAISFL